MDSLKLRRRKPENGRHSPKYVHLTVESGCLGCCFCPPHADETVHLNSVSTLSPTSTMQDYFTSRSNLAGVLLLIDASIPPMKKDKEYADWLIQHNVPFTIVFTKCDRNKPDMPTVEENQYELEQQLMVRSLKNLSMLIINIM